jgi:hypothetical protein
MGWAYLGAPAGSTGRFAAPIFGPFPQCGGLVLKMASKSLNLRDKILSLVGVSAVAFQDSIGYKISIVFSI